MSISFTSHIDLRLTLNSGQIFHWREKSPGVFIVIQNNTVLKIQQKSNIEIILDQFGVKLGKKNLKRLLGFRRNPSKIFDTLSKDQLIKPFISDYRGLTIMHQDPYECLISFMTSSMSNIPRIMLNLKNLRLMGNSIIEGTAEYLFPSPKKIVSLGEKEMRKIGFGYRAKYINLVCNKIIREKIDFQHWERKTDQELKLNLMNFPGVGNKISECVMLFGFGRSGAFPIDIWIKRAMLALEPTLNGLTNEELCIWGKKRWGKNAGLAQQILFIAIRNGEIPYK